MYIFSLDLFPILVFYLKHTEPKKRLLVLKHYLLLFVYYWFRHLFLGCVCFFGNGYTLDPDMFALVFFSIL